MIYYLSTKLSKTLPPGSYSNFVQGKYQLSECNGMEGVIIYSPQSIEYQSFF